MAGFFAQSIKIKVLAELNSYLKTFRKFYFFFSFLVHSYCPEIFFFFFFGGSMTEIPISLLLVALYRPLQFLEAICFTGHVVLSIFIPAIFLIQYQDSSTLNLNSSHLPIHADSNNTWLTQAYLSNPSYKATKHDPDKGMIAYHIHIGFINYHFQN